MSDMFYVYSDYIVSNIMRLVKISITTFDFANSFVPFIITDVNDLCDI